MLNKIWPEILIWSGQHSSQPSEPKRIYQKFQICHSKSAALLILDNL